MKKVFSSIFSSRNRDDKYQPEKGVPECARKTTPVMHRGNVSWELADFRNHLEAETQADYPSITSGKLCLPTEQRVVVGFTVYPKGISAQTWEYLGFRFTVHSLPNESAHISYKILMLNSKRKVLATSEGSKEFKAKDFVEIDKLIRLESLNNKKGQQLLLGKESNVTFVCEITARTDFKESNFNSVQVDFGAACAAGKDRLSEDMKLLLCGRNDGPSITPDVVLIINAGTKEFPVHSLILDVRAPRLLASLKEDNKTCNGEMGGYFVPDIKAEVLQELIYYLYTGTVFGGKKALKDFELLAAAIKFKVDELQKLCELVLTESLTVNLVVKMLNKVETEVPGAEALKASIYSFIGRHSEAVSKTRDWKSLVAENPHFLSLLNSGVPFSITGKVKGGARK